MGMQPLRVGHYPPSKEFRDLAILAVPRPYDHVPVIGHHAVPEDAQRHAIDQDRRRDIRLKRKKVGFSVSGRDSPCLPVTPIVRQPILHMEIRQRFEVSVVCQQGCVQRPTQGGKDHVHLGQHTSARS